MLNEESLIREGPGGWGGTTRPGGTRPVLQGGVETAAEKLELTGTITVFGHTRQGVGSNRGRLEGNGWGGSVMREGGWSNWREGYRGTGKFEGVGSSSCLKSRRRHGRGQWSGCGEQEEERRGEERRGEERRTSA
eukprot:755748-Hanusia_phi.AAC.11